MATPHMASLYKELQRVFDARPTNLAKTGKLLTNLKVSPLCRISHESSGHFGL